jgi:UDP-N-acetylglucosamine--N-acetylmuramyl-(pentapeptide) pyrophosphoryl-undecaprenol N-acetylglucosamine transferase
MARTFVIAAGGTGGHLFPGIAVADELKARDPQARVVFAGTPRGLESRLVPRSGHELVLLPILPLNGVGVPRALKGLLALPWGLLKAGALVARLRPEAVLGVGGYAGGPVVLVAALMRIPTVILEPNARAGFTNRVLKRFVRHAACSYEASREEFGSKFVLTGNPVRGGFARIPRKEHGPPYTLLAFGGSQGSRVLNRALVAALPHLPGPDRLRIVHQTGEALRDEVVAGYAAAGREAEILPFLDDMEARFARADVVLSRSGATTCAELAAAGKAAVLVPFALAADDHQRSNAVAMEKAGAARMVEEKDLTGERLAGVLGEVLADPVRLAGMEDAARALARPDAAARVADLLEGRNGKTTTETQRHRERT